MSETYTIITPQQRPSKIIATSVTEASVYRTELVSKFEESRSLLKRK
jgi:hypothetical protein